MIWKPRGTSKGQFGKLRVQGKNQTEAENQLHIIHKGCNWIGGIMENVVLHVRITMMGNNCVFLKRVYLF